MNSFNTVLYTMLGEKIRQKRDEKRISQTELSEKIKLGRASVSNIEKGRQQPPLHIIYSICEVLDIDIQSLLPAASEVRAKSNEDSSNSEIEKYLKSQDLNVDTLKKIEETLKKIKK